MCVCVRVCVCVCACVCVKISLSECVSVCVHCGFVNTGVHSHLPWTACSRTCVCLRASGCVPAAQRDSSWRLRVPQPSPALSAPLFPPSFHLLSILLCFLPFIHHSQPSPSMLSIYLSPFCNHLLYHQLLYTFPPPSNPFILICALLFTPAPHFPRSFDRLCI